MKVIDSKLNIASVPDEEFAIKEDEARATVLDNDTGERLNDEEAGVRLEKVVVGDLDSLGIERQMVQSTLKEAEE